MNPTQVTEHTINHHIQGCIRNNRDSQRELYKYFYGFAMGICLRFANDKLDATGILNDGFLKVFQNIATFDQSKEFLPWLRRIITNTAVDYYRANLKFANHVGLDGQEIIPQLSTIYDKLAYNDLLALIQKLTPAYRTVFNLYAIDGYTHEQISEILKISTGTSKSNLFKARKKLQDMLSETDLKTYKMKISENINSQTRGDLNIDM